MSAAGRRHWHHSWIVLVVLLNLGACGGSGPAAAMEQFMYATDRGQYEDALAFMPPSVRDMVGDEKLTQAFRELDRDIDEKSGIDDIEILEESMTSDTEAIIVLRTVYGNGESRTNTMTMVKIYDKWAISECNLAGSCGGGDK